MRTMNLLQVESMIKETPVEYFDGRNCHIAMERLHKYGFHKTANHSKVSVVASKVLHRASSLEKIAPKHLASIFYCAAQWKLVGDSIPPELIKRVKEIDLPGAPPATLAQAVWSLHQLREADEDFLNKVANYLLREDGEKLSHFTPSQLALLLVAPAKSLGPELITEIARKICSGAIPASKFSITNMARILPILAQQQQQGQVFPSVLACFAPHIPALLPRAQTWEIASLMYALFRANVAILPCFEHELKSRNILDFTFEEASKICLALARERKTTFWFLDALARNNEYFQRREFSLSAARTFLSALNEARLASPPFCNKLIARAAVPGEHFGEFGARDLHLCLCALEACNYSANGLRQTVFAQRFKERLKQVRLGALSTDELTGMVSMGNRLEMMDIAPILLAELKTRTDLASLLKPTRGDCALVFTSPQEWSSALLEFGSLGLGHAQFWQAQANLLQSSEVNLASFPTRALCAALAGFARSADFDPAASLAWRRQVCHEFANAIQRRTEEAFNLPDIAQLLTSFAQLDARIPLIVDRFEREICALRFGANNLPLLCQVLHATAKLHCKSPRLCQRLAKEIDVADCTPAQLLALLEAFVSHDHRKNAFCQQVAERVLGSTTNFSLLADFFFAFAQLRFKPEYGLLHCTAAALLSSQHADTISKASSKSLARFVFSMAMLNWKEEEAMLDAIAREVCTRLANGEEARGKDLVSLMWGFAALDALHRDCVQALFASKPPPLTLSFANVGRESLYMLAMVRLAWKHANGDKASSSALLDGFAHYAQPVCENTPSLTHRGIYNKLVALGVRDLQNEYVISNLLTVDMYLERKQLCIECDGPHHYLQDGKTLTGKTRFKHRMLKNEGYLVLSVPAMELQRMSPEAQHAAMQALANLLQSP